MNNPLITIVTVSMNVENIISRTIESVVNQSYKNIQYIIIDGGSSDGTTDIIKKYDDHIDYWVSESDLGLYDAMNKGILIARGDFINFINAGDTLIDSDSISNIVKSIGEKDLVYFSTASIVADKITWLYPGKDVGNIKKWLKYSLPNHQTMFFPKNFYKNNLYDIRLVIRGDDDYKLLALKKLQIKYLDQIYVIFKRDGISSSHKGLRRLAQRVYESIIINYKHKRYVRLIIDPTKLLFMFFINSAFGDESFTKMINLIVKLKSFK